MCSDDCYLFLEMVMVVCEVLYFLYIGEGVCDGKLCNLVVLLVELL